MKDDAVSVAPKIHKILFESAGKTTVKALQVELKTTDIPLVLHQWMQSSALLARSGDLNDSGVIKNEHDVTRHATPLLRGGS